MSLPQYTKIPSDPYEVEEPSTSPPDTTLPTESTPTTYPPSELRPATVNTAESLPGSIPTHLSSYVLVGEDFLWSKREALCGRGRNRLVRSTRYSFMKKKKIPPSPHPSLPSHISSLSLSISIEYQETIEFLESTFPVLLNRDSSTISFKAELVTSRSSEPAGKDTKTTAYVSDVFWEDIMIQAKPSRIIVEVTPNKMESRKRW